MIIKLPKFFKNLKWCVAVVLVNCIYQYTNWGQIHNNTFDAWFSYVYAILTLVGIFLQGLLGILEAITNGLERYIERAENRLANIAESD